MICQHCGFRCESCSYERTPIVCNNDTFSTVLQKQLSGTDDEITHSFENLVGAILGQAVAAAISRHVDRDENVIL
jgi:hypothetical protein